MISPVDLSRALGQAFPPTEQQAAVIGAPMESSLVVAGAGAGKTETMAARVVWLVAEGLVAPEEVLGLTFTNKAAQQLASRISSRLNTLKASPQLDELDRMQTRSRSLRASLDVIAPTVATYDSFAGSIVREFGLLLPVEPSARIVSNTELYLIADRVLQDYRGTLETSLKPSTIVSHIVELSGQMQSNLVSPEQVREETEALFAAAEDVPGGSEKLNQKAKSRLQVQQLRLDLLPIVERFREVLREERLMTFSEQMALAAQVAQDNPVVGRTLGQRFKVVLLDEYQDTSYAQRVLLTSLFSESCVTAVGDPMQSIYGWRGGTASNLEVFPTDFPNGEQPATTYELTTSFRNPPHILELANNVAVDVLGSPQRPDRLVQPLEALEGRPRGEAMIGSFQSASEEIEVVADSLAQRYHGRDTSRPFTAAVLLRKQRHFAAVEQALRSRGVPVEIVGLSGLLLIPEVADIIALATMVIDPDDDKAALRILAGPAVGLSAADIKALATRAEQLSGTTPRVPPHDDPLEHLQAVIEAEQSTDPDRSAGLADAVADLGEPDSYGLSSEAAERLRDLAAKLRYLRTNAAQQPLPDFFAAVEQIFNIRTEVLQRTHSDGRVVGSVHLDRFAEVVEEFSRIKGATLRNFLRYTALAIENDKGLEPGTVEVHADRVQILTVHKAKGLEWQHVAVMHCDVSTYAAKGESWVSLVHHIPSSLLGDADHEGTSIFGSPVLNDLDTETPAAFAKALEAHIGEFKEKNAGESIRLFYVAITRAEESLMVTSSEKAPLPCFAALEPLADTVIEWTLPKPGEGEAPQPPSGYFPSEYHPKGAQLVLDALDSLPALIHDGDIFEAWEQEVSAMIEEHQALANPNVTVALPRELTATDLVTLKANPERFARRKRRPVPFKPNAYAKRGTAFHEWIEQQFGAVAFLDEDQLPGAEEYVEENLEELKAAFLASPWSKRTPVAVEQGFEVSIGAHLLRGRMDAVFKQDDGYIVIDWKTGQPPTASERASVEMQLAVYRLAWAKLRGIDPSKVRAAFYYVSRDILLQPADLPDEAALESLLEAQNENTVG